MSKGDAIQRFEIDIRALGLPEPLREHVFHRGRRWRFDYCWLESKVAVEIDGGTWVGGRHTSGAGYEADCSKFNQAVIDGWKIFRFTTNMVLDGRAFSTLEKAKGG